MKLYKILRSLVQSDNFYSLAGNIIVALFGMINFSLMARGFSEKEDFGEWILFMVVNSVVEMVRIGLCRSGFIKFYNSSAEHRKKYLIGSTYQILAGSSIVILSIMLIIRLFFYSYVEDTSFAMFFQWYIYLLLATTPYIQAQILLQAKSDFKTILKLRFIFLSLFTIYLGYTYWEKGTYDLQEVVLVYIIINAIISLISIIFRYDGMKYFFRRKKGELRILLRFGIYNVGTQLGANLLKSSDSFILGLFACLGTPAIATYGVAYKMIELIEIPVRSFSATAFPKMSFAAIGQDKTVFSNLFYQHVGFLSLILIPVLVISYFFADFIVLVLGGAEYLDAVPILQIFLLYGLLIPFERLTGVALDSLNKPKVNFYKVFIMLFVNVGGNIVVVLLSCMLWPVAAVTIVTVITGSIVGYIALNKLVKLQLLKIITEGIGFIKTFIKNKGQLNFG